MPGSLGNADPGGSIVRRLAWVFLHQVAGRGAVFAFFALLPVWLPLDVAGAFILAYTAMQVMVQPAFDTAVNTLLVRAAAQGDRAAVRQLVHWALALLGVLLGTGLAVVALGGLAPLWAWLAAYFALSLPLNMAFAVCRGRGRFDVEGIVGSLQKVSVLPLLAVLKADANAPAQALFLSTIVGWTLLGAGFGRTWLRARETWRASPGAPTDGAPLRETLSLTALATIALLYLRIDLAFLGAFSGLRDIGIYATASRWMEAAFVLPFGVMLVLFPQLSRRPMQRGDLGRTFRLFLIVGIVTFAASVAAALLIVPLVYDHAIGPEIARLLILLSPSALAVCVGMLSSQTLVAWGRTSLALAAALVGLGTKLVIALAAIPRLGTSGAALAAVATEVAVAIAAGMLLRRVMNERS